MFRRVVTLFVLASAVTMITSGAALARGGNAGADPRGDGGPGHRGEGRRMSVPELDPAAAGAIAAVIGGGALLVVRRRKRE